MVRSILVMELENWRILLIRFVWLELENGLEFKLTPYIYLHVQRGGKQERLRANSILKRASAASL